VQENSKSDRNICSKIIEFSREAEAFRNTQIDLKTSGKI
jgi:hypothetical protein